MVRHKTTSVSSGRNQMHTDDLVAICDALTAIIALPPPIREVVASLVAHRATPNREDPRPPAFPAARTPPRSSHRKLIGECNGPRRRM
jgi:hypothetical protein